MDSRAIWSGGGQREAENLLLKLLFLPVIGTGFLRRIFVKICFIRQLIIYLLPMIISVERDKIMFLLKLLLGSRGQDLEGGGNVTGKPSNYPPKGLRSSGYGSTKDS